MLSIEKTSTLEAHFASFRKNIIGINHSFESPYGRQRLIYMDWTASGRLYAPIEDTIREKIAPLIGNTHTETSITGTSMTIAYHEARSIIKKHVNAAKDDVLICAGSGMTGALSKFQRIIGVKVPDKIKKYTQCPENERPIVFVTHKEHHSNHTSWLEALVDVERIEPDAEGLVDLNHLALLLTQYKDRKHKIAAITSCSNVTGIFTPYHEIAAMMHRAGGLCFVDFACSAPYVKIDMHPKDQAEAYLDAVYFSPHKFLGGVGTTGVVVFSANLYSNKVPDDPGGGTVVWTNPWGEHEYITDIESREDGGTPPFMQVIRTALAVRLKEKMGVDTMLAREEELLHILFPRLEKIKGLHILAQQHQHRLGVISFYIDDLHFNLGVKILNDRFGIQVRGGCSCAGTYGHYLLNVSREQSKHITDNIDKGILSEKPGWIRLSVHPTTTNEELNYVIEAIEQLAANHHTWAKDYTYSKDTNEFTHYAEKSVHAEIAQWFED